MFLMRFLPIVTSNSRIGIAWKSCQLLKALQRFKLVILPLTKSGLSLIPTSLRLFRGIPEATLNTIRSLRTANRVVKPRLEARKGWRLRMSMTKRVMPAQGLQVITRINFEHNKRFNSHVDN